MDEHKRLYSRYPIASIANVGYGSEDNYNFAERNGIIHFVKYNYFHKEQTKRLRDDPFRNVNFHYDPDRNCYFFRWFSRWSVSIQLGEQLPANHHLLSDPQVFRLSRAGRDGARVMELV